MGLITVLNFKHVLSNDFVSTDILCLKLNIYMTVFDNNKALMGNQYVFKVTVTDLVAFSYPSVSRVN